MDAARSAEGAGDYVEARMLLDGIEARFPDNAGILARVDDERTDVEQAEAAYLASLDNGGDDERTRGSLAAATARPSPTQRRGF